MEIRDAEAAVDNEWKKVETPLAWQLGEVNTQEGRYSGSTKRRKDSPLCYTDGIYLLKKAELEHQFQTYTDRVVLRGDTVRTILYLVNKVRQFRK